VSGAIDLRAALEDVGLSVRMGLHVGEVAVRDDDVVGIAVHVAARVMSAAGPGDIFVSGTVAAVATGGTHRFVHVDHEPLRGLEGVEGEWEVLAVE
jgi:class 3 adenylate cyclase